MERRSFITSCALGALSMAFPRVSMASSGRWDEFARPLMGTFVSIAVYEEQEGAARRHADACFDYLEGCIAQISNWDSSSATWAANAQKNLQRAASSELVFSLARSARDIQKLTKGKFNPSILSLTRLWREAKSASSLPSTTDLKYCLRDVERSGFEVNDHRLQLFGASGLEFDGIGKGMIADLGAQFLRSKGVSFARIACSGDIRFLGDTAWHVEVEAPDGGDPLGSLTLRGDVAIASSGDYRNCWTVNGQRYHHLIDPATGQPGRACRQTTVIASTCMLADALAVGAFFLPPEKAIDLLDSLPIKGAVVVSADNKVFLGQVAKFSRNFSLTRS
ncbi:MAG: FAD:protein FMN transferase [Deltaproteobacteria bacterium]|nr:FAD:protein FMN transferase [Deltaproteobacteria bacterium]